MNEKQRFWLLLSLFIVSVILLIILNTALGQQVLVHSQ